MDKLKNALAVAKKQYFWILSSLAVVVGLAAWYQATADLAKRFETRRSALMNHFQEMQKIVAETNHPNPKMIESIEKKTDALKENVLMAWELLYQEQKDKNRLPDGLSDEFKRAFEALGPKNRLPDYLLEHYQNFIEGHFKQVFQIIDVRRPADAPAPTGAAAPGATGAGPIAHAGEVDVAPATTTTRPRASVHGPADKGVEMVGIVEWDGAEALPSRFRWETRPSTLEVRIAQEDLWVYEALLRVIKNTNAGATAHYNAKVKRIIAMEIGQDVIRGAAQRSPRGGGPSGPMAIAPGMGAGGPIATAAGETEYAPAAGATTTPDATVDAETQRLISDRYVNEEGKPLQAGQEPPYAEFNMMPFRLELVMDQRELPRLLSECANSNMPIEARLVRIRPGEAPPITIAAPTVSSQEGGEQSASLGGPGEAFKYSSSAKRPIAISGGKQVAGEYGPFDVPVEIRGIIYIYNKPDRAKLGTGAATEKPEEPAAPEQPAPAPGETPTTPPPSPTPTTSPTPPSTPALPGVPRPGIPASGVPSAPIAAPPAGGVPALPVAPAPPPAVPAPAPAGP